MLNFAESYGVTKAKSSGSKSTDKFVPLRSNRAGNPIHGTRTMPYRSMVGETGFEPATPWSQTRCATSLRHSPTALRLGKHGEIRKRPVIAMPECCIQVRILGSSRSALRDNRDQRSEMMAIRCGMFWWCDPVVAGCFFSKSSQRRRSEIAMRTKLTPNACRPDDRH